MAIPKPAAFKLANGLRDWQDHRSLCYSGKNGDDAVDGESELPSGYLFGIAFCKNDHDRANVRNAQQEAEKLPEPEVMQIFRIRSLKISDVERPGRLRSAFPTTSRLHAELVELDTVDSTLTFSRAAKRTSPGGQEMGAKRNR